MASPPQRIVSLLPSATEIVGLLGVSHRLVGRSHECDFPPGLDHLPVLTAPRVHGTDPGEIDAQVRDALAQGRSLYELDEPALRALRPDLILTQDLCAVCSIDLAAVRRAAATFDPAPAILSLNPTTLDGVLDDVLSVGRATGTPDVARDAVVRLRERLARAQDHVNPYAEPAPVGFLEWTDPPFVAGHWTVQIIERAGGSHPLNQSIPQPGAGAAAGPQASQRTVPASRRVEWDEFVESRPEWLVICPCGLDLRAASASARGLTSRPGWSDIPAVRSGRVAVVDGNQMFNRPGPRLVDAFEWMVGWMTGQRGLIPPWFPWCEELK
ncbi:MAG: ABC transporter substrate-binding protein [Planctomycetota bacterium]|nr:ABC transporter substrate-binding protein [Planctomycetota bacterium]